MIKKEVILSHSPNTLLQLTVLKNLLLKNGIVYMTIQITIKIINSMILMFSNLFLMTLIR